MNEQLSILTKLEKDLSLKQLQIKALLTITQAINDNIPSAGLFNMYKSFLSWEMGIEKMALFITSDKGWKCAANIQFDEKRTPLIIPHLLPHKRLYTIKPKDDNALKHFDIIIPVFHKDLPIAYAIIGGIKEKEDLYNKIQFITTITNIIAVAIENKRLFKKQIQQERLSREMELASEVQQMLIPKKLPITDKFEVAKIYKPHFNVGGDYLDYIPFSNNKFALCIADISGKGVSAALLMSNFQAMIQSLIFQYRDLETFVVALNQAVFKITHGERFITFFLAEVDIDQHTIKYVNAGHYPPAMIDANGLRRLDSGCTVIGAFDKLPDIKEEIITLKGDAMLLAFTDGLADLQNVSGEYFEDEKIADFLNKYGGLGALDFNKALLEEIDSFKGDQSFADDIAILTCKIRG